MEHQLSAQLEKYGCNLAWTDLWMPQIFLQADQFPIFDETAQLNEMMFAQSWIYFQPDRKLRPYSASYSLSQAHRHKGKRLRQNRCNNATRKPTEQVKTMQFRLLEMATEKPEAIPWVETSDSALAVGHYVNIHCQNKSWNVRGTYIHPAVTRYWFINAIKWHHILYQSNIDTGDSKIAWLPMWLLITPWLWGHFPLLMGLKKIGTVFASSALS